MDIGTLQARCNQYKQVLDNTIQYRKDWQGWLKKLIIDTIEDIAKKADLRCDVKSVDKIENLESVVLDLGKSSSGISEHIEDSGVKRTMIKSNGALIYQQLFNGKVIIMVLSPHIEGYGEPKPPKTLEILRPEELKPPFILRHIETLIKEVTDWEDYDDDLPQKTIQAFSPIGFNRNNGEPFEE